MIVSKINDTDPRSSAPLPRRIVNSESASDRLVEYKLHSSLVTMSSTENGPEYRKCPLCNKMFFSDPYEDTSVECSTMTMHFCQEYCRNKYMEGYTIKNLKLFDIHVSILVDKKTREYSNTIHAGYEAFRKWARQNKSTEMPTIEFLGGIGLDKESFTYRFITESKEKDPFDCELTDEQLQTIAKEARPYLNYDDPSDIEVVSCLIGEKIGSVENFIDAYKERDALRLFGQIWWDMGTLIKKSTTKKQLEEEIRRHRDDIKKLGYLIKAKRQRIK